MFDDRTQKKLSSLPFHHISLSDICISCPPSGAQGQFEKIPFHYKKRGNMTQQSTSRLFFTFLQAQKYHHLRSCLSCGKL